MVEQLLRTVEPGPALVPYNLLENTVKQVKIITVFPLIVALRAKTNFWGGAIIRVSKGHILFNITGEIRVNAKW